MPLTISDSRSIFLLIIGYIPFLQVVLISCVGEVAPLYSWVFIFVLIKKVVKLSLAGQGGCREGSYEQFLSELLDFFFPSKNSLGQSLIKSL